MKIVRVETIPVSLPVGDFRDGCSKVGAIHHPPKFSSGRTHRHHLGSNNAIVLSNVIVKIHTDEGLIGIGEAACDATEPVRNVRNMIDRYMAPVLIGEDPLDWEFLIDRVAWDSPRVGSNPNLDAESVIGIWERLGPDISLRADANCGYTVKQARTFCRLIEQSGAELEVLEQPTAKLDIDGMKAVRDSTDIPIEADESAFSLEMVYRLLHAGAVDLINTKCAKAMGIKGVREWATVARAAGTGIVIGTEWGSAAIVAAKLHLGAAIVNADPVVEFTEIMIHDLLHKDPIVLEDGYIRVPTAPGLGTELDETKVARYRTPDA